MDEREHSGALRLDGASGIYAVFGDPVVQVQTPRLINPLFARHGRNLFAIPFHVTPPQLEATWGVFREIDNVAGIGVTVPHKVAAAGLCDELTDAARAVGAVNSIQRRPDGAMHGALFDGIGFVEGLGDNAARLKDARILMLGAGGAGRAIAHALATLGIKSLGIVDPDTEAIAFTMAMVNRVAGGTLAYAAEPDLSGVEVLINASPVGVKAGLTLPISLSKLTADVLVADIASLAGNTELLRAATAAGCFTSDGNDMLEAQIDLIAGFAAGGEAGVPIS